MSSLLNNLQQEIKARLQADPFFSQTRQLADLSYVTIPVFAEDETEIENSIAMAVGKIGVAVIIAAVVADVSFDNVPGPFFDNIIIVVRIGETVVVNRGTASAPSATGTLKSAAEIAEKVHSILHHWVPDGISTPVRSDKPSIVNTSNEDYNARDCRFHCASGLSYAIPQVATPVLVDTGAHKFTATCATAGAAIFYATDGRQPTPRSGTLYTGEVTLGGASTVKVKAWLAGYLVSDLATLNVV